MTFSRDRHLEDVVPDAVDAPTAIQPMLDIQDLSRLLKASERAIYRWIDAGTFPPPIKLGRINRWHPSVIDRHLRSHSGLDTPPRRGRRRTTTGRTSDTRF